MAYRVTVTGDKALARRLRTTERGLDNLSPTHRRTAAVVQRTARAMAPKRTGRLAASTRAHATRRAAVITFGSVYAGPVHWGWPNRPDHARGWRGGPISPNPFAARAAKATEGGWTRLYHRAVDRLLNGDSQI
ncbi:hypothetical protein ACIRJS_16575 [Streptomyces sp. NPDC102340]|uniref:hypothetical protein n=1 Tax=unclassified Streptomyces TaxID=2593676 RepID=UPI003813429D